MHKPVSVITINYNNLKGLKRTLDSVWNQTARQSIELVVIDGGSKDGSAEYLKEHAGSIDVLVSEKDKGIYDAMNKGLHAANGKYVWFVNSGDAIYEKSVTEKLLPILAQNPDVVFGDTMFIDSNDNELGLISRLKPQPLPEKLGPESFRFGMNFCHQSFIARKEICPDYDLQYRQAADIDWILQILKKQPSSVKAAFTIAAFETGGSSTQNEKKALKERYKVLSKHYGALPNFAAHIWILIRRVLFNTGIWRPGK